MMMRESSFDEQEATDVSEKSLAIRSMSMNTSRMYTNDLRDSDDPRCEEINCRNEEDEARTNESNRRLGREEEERKQASESKRLKEEGQRTGVRSRPIPPTPQDFLRHVQAAESNRRAGTSWWERVVVQRSAYVVDDLVEQYTAGSPFLQSEPFPVAWLDRSELETGELLGAGTYSNVYRVQKLDLFSDFLEEQPEQDQLRSELLLKSKSSGAGGDSTDSATSGTSATSGYAIKHLKSELLKNTKLFEAAAADLIMEAKFLSRLSHPNILKLRGMAIGGSSAFSKAGLYDSYFLMVDELEETLIQRIQLWRHQGSSDQYQNPMILFKLRLAVQIASALAYLHERRLVFRDLKPHNIGLKQDGTIMLFDFGFCRELPPPSSALPRGVASLIRGAENYLPPENPPSTEEEDCDRLYCMSGKGTLLYMSAEILSSRCYNQKADVYSWAMVTYELLTLLKPFAVTSIDHHKKLICEQGQRPLLLHMRWLDTRIKEVLQHSWEANVQARWQMKDVKEALDDIIQELEKNRGPFTKDTSYGTTNSGSMFCQAGYMDSIILDVTNTIQTRYEYIMNTIFCQGSTKDVSETNPDPVVISDSLAAKLKSNGCTTEQGSLKCDQAPSRQSLAYSSVTDVATFSSGAANRSGEEKKVEHNFFFALSSLSMAPSLLVSTSSPRMAQKSEQFPMTSLSMHSVRLAAARNRRTTASTVSHSLTDLGPKIDGSGDSRRASLSMISQKSEISKESLRAFNEGPNTSPFSGVLQTIRSEEDKSTEELDTSKYSGVLQTIRSEEDKSADEAFFDAENEADSKPAAVQDEGMNEICFEADKDTDSKPAAVQKVNVMEAGSETARLPYADKKSSSDEKVLNNTASLSADHMRGKRLSRPFISKTASI